MNDKIAELLGGTQGAKWDFKRSRRGVPYVRTVVHHDEVTICWFKRKKEFRIFKNGKVVKNCKTRTECEEIVSGL